MGVLLFLVVYVIYLVLLRCFPLYIRSDFFLWLPVAFIFTAFLFAVYYVVLRRCGTTTLGGTDVLPVVAVRHNAVSMCNSNITSQLIPVNSFALPVFTFLLVVTVSLLCVQSILLH